MNFVGGEDSDLDENTDNSENSEEEVDRREGDSDGEEHSPILHYAFSSWIEKTMTKTTYFHWENRFVLQ